MKKNLNLFAFIFTIFCFLAVPNETKAQYIGTSPYIKYSNNIFVNSNMHLFFQKRWQIARLRAAGKHEVADALEGRRTNKGQPVNNSAPAASGDNSLRRVPLSQTSFKSNKETIMPFVLGAETLEAGKEEREFLVKAAVELLKNYEQMLAEQKETRLRNNVAGAAAFAILMSRSILTDGSELGEAQSEAVLQDINALLASSDNFKKLPDLDKQKMYETFVITTGLAAMFYQQGKEENDAEKIEQGRDLAKTILAQFFDRPIDEIRFTEQGVEFN
jgi:hypothetical protein